MKSVFINAHIIVTVDAVDIEQTMIENKDLGLSTEQAAKAAAWNTEAMTALDKICHKTKNNICQGMAKLQADGKWHVHFMVSEA